MRDVGRTREEIVSHELKASDLQAFQVLFQHPKWFIEPINHRNVWQVALHVMYIITAFSMWFIVGIIINRY